RVSALAWVLDDRYPGPVVELRDAFANTGRAGFVTAITVWTSGGHGLAKGKTRCESQRARSSGVGAENSTRWAVTGWSNASSLACSARRAGCHASRTPYVRSANTGLPIL